MEEIIGEDGGLRGGGLESCLVVWVEEPVADELGEIFAGAETGVGSDDVDDFGSFMLETVFHVINVDFAVFGGKVGELVKGGAGTVGADGDEFFLETGDAAGLIAGQSGSRMVARKLEIEVVAEGIEGGEPASGDELVGGENGIAAEVGLNIPWRGIIGESGSFMRGDIGIGDFRDREGESLGFEGSEEGIESGFGHGIVRFGGRVDEAEEDAGGASVGIDSAVRPGRVRGNVGIKLGWIGIDAESGQKDVPSNGAGESVVFLEVAPFGGG